MFAIQLSFFVIFVMVLKWVIQILATIFFSHIHLNFIHFSSCLNSNWPIEHFHLFALVNFSISYSFFGLYQPKYVYADLIGKIT